MKKIISLLLTLCVGIGCFAQSGKLPFAAQHKDCGYSKKEIIDTVTNTTRGMAIPNAVLSDLQGTADQDGWNVFIPDGKITLGYMVFLLKNATEIGCDNWSTGEVSVAYITKDRTVIYLERPSYKVRIGKVLGDEPVLILDVTKYLGWTDKNGNPFPKRSIIARRCCNTLIDHRNPKFVPVKNTSIPEDSIPAIKPVAVKPNFAKPDTIRSSSVTIHTDTTINKFYVRNDTVYFPNTLPDYASKIKQSEPEPKSESKPHGGYFAGSGTVNEDVYRFNHFQPRILILHSGWNHDPMMYRGYGPYTVGSGTFKAPHCDRPAPCNPGRGR